MLVDCGEPVHALLLCVYRTARLRDGSATDARDGLALGKEAQYRKKSGVDWCAVVGGVKHDEGDGHQV